MEPFSAIISIIKNGHIKKGHKNEYSKGGHHNA